MLLSVFQLAFVKRHEKSKFELYVLKHGEEANKRSFDASNWGVVPKFSFTIMEDI